MNKRVAISAIGVRSPLGCTTEEVYTNIAQGTRCIAEIENLDTGGFSQKAAGEIRSSGKVVKTPPTVDRKAHFLEEAIRSLDDFSHFTKRYQPQDLVLNTGSGVDYVHIEKLFNDKEYLLDEGEELTSHHKSYALIREIARKFNIDGGVNVFTAACVASTQAIGTSYRMIRKGYRKAAVTGGSDSMINYVNFLGFQNLGAMSSSADAPYACKPFDLKRDGTILGEGAIMILLEELPNAPEDKIDAEIVGYGTTMDAYAVTDPDPAAASLARAIEKALSDAGITPEMIDCVHLHGTATPKNAPCEYKALKQVFGTRAATLPVYSLKGQTGHLIGSCGALEILAAIYSLKNQVVLPTVNFREQDPEAPLFVITKKPYKIKIDYLLKLNSSFGGENTALILKRHQLWDK
jgi:3-oxoacyl-[acyl-carrier-protein] synthase II